MDLNPVYGHVELEGESKTDNALKAPRLDTRRAVGVKQTTWTTSSWRQWLRVAGVVLALVMSVIALAMSEARRCGASDADSCSKSESYATQAQLATLNRTLALRKSGDHEVYASRSGFRQQLSFGCAAEGDVTS